MYKHQLFFYLALITPSWPWPCPWCVFLAKLFKLAPVEAL